MDPRDTRVSASTSSPGQNKKSRVEVRETEEGKTRRSVASALKDYMESMSGPMLVQNSVGHPAPPVLQDGNAAVRQSSGAHVLSRAYMGEPAITYHEYCNVY